MPFRSTLAVLCWAACEPCGHTVACEGLTEAWLTCVFFSELRSKAAVGSRVRCTSVVEALIDVGARLA